ncbi:MAG TPA: alpha/beta hydrolase, partial [Clostridia bacterium]|nr:alpha/beta hydrolase [Clostridia bacterium]
MSFRFSKLIKLLVCITVCFTFLTATVNAEAIKPTRYVNTMFKKADIESNLVYGQAKNYKGEKEELKLDVYQPSGDSGPGRSSIVFVHGGGLVSGSKSESFYKDFIMEFVKKGYVVFSIDYRLRDNQDQFMDAMKDACDDAVLAVKWVQKNANKYKLDKKHIVFMGHSAGSDIINNLCYNDKMSGKLPKDSIFTVVEVAGSGLSVYTDNGTVKKGGPSCFIVHGTQDEYAPYNLSEEFAEALRQSGTPYAIHLLKDGTHLFREDFYEVVDETTQFLNNQLMGFNIRINKQLA